MDIGLVTAFLGGLLALLSPCGALLLPAFFASTVGAGPRLLVHAGLFYVGLTVVLVPLGLGAGAVGTLFVTHRETIILVTSLVLIALGTAQALGFGFDPARLVPGASMLQSQASSRAGLTKTLLLGAASGVAGLCAGPILGAVLTLAAADGDIISAGVLLAVYGAGMVVPLTGLAACWGRIGQRGQRILRGRAVTVLGRQLHSTSMITGVLIAAVGVLFWTTNGLVGMPESVPVALQSRLQEGMGLLANPLIDLGAVLVLAVTVLVVWVRVRRRGRPDGSGVVSDSSDSRPTNR